MPVCCVRILIYAPHKQVSSNYTQIFKEKYLGNKCKCAFYRIFLHFIEEGEIIQEVLLKTKIGAFSNII
jgi:hypothetical protein